MVFQEPMTALNALFTVGDQIAEVLELHEGLGKPAAREAAVQLLADTGIPDPARRARIAFSMTSTEEPDMAAAATSGVARPMIATGTARAL